MEKIRDVVNSFNFPKVESDLTVWLIMEGKEYELSQFSIGFGQEVDFKGQPQDAVRGGRMILTIVEALPESMYQWAMKSNQKNGGITFRSKTANAPFKVEFMNAFCVNFDRVVDGHGGITTNLIVSPEEVSVNGESLDNNWV